MAEMLCSFYLCVNNYTHNYTYIYTHKYIIKFFTLVLYSYVEKCYTNIMHKNIIVFGQIKIKEYYIYVRTNNKHNI